MKAYTKSPTATVGRDSKVLSDVMTKRFPENALKAMKNPPGTPTTLAMSVDVELTFRDTRTVSRSPGSSDQMSNKADRRPSTIKSIE